MLLLILFSALVPLIAPLSCLSQTEQPVEWWVIFKTPPKTGINAFGYYDSTMRSENFKYYDVEVDLGPSALTYTIDAFNQGEYDNVAWNDEKPSGQVSTYAAHSKGFIGLDVSKKQGIFVTHSIPKYPGFINGKIDKEIAPGEEVYGQNLACFSLSLTELEQIASYLMITKPYVYQVQIQDTPQTQNLYKLSQSTVLTSDQLFLTADLRPVQGEAGLKSIYKNYKVNGSIFEDGLTEYLKAPSMMAETWGRPLAAAWCSQGKEVSNVLKMKVGNLVWNQADDHSKWVLAGRDYVCFGDLNRMTSQWKRGGSYYCLNHKYLIQAVWNTVVTYDGCNNDKVKRLSTQ